MTSSSTKLLAFFALALFMLHADEASMPTLRHKQAEKTWCVAKPSADEAALRANMEFACSESDCSAIQGAGGCGRSAGTVASRASAAMNAYYQAMGRNAWNCFFNGTGLITITDPSLGSCKYV